MHKAAPLGAPLHPHPLSNDLTTERLPMRGAREVRERAGLFHPSRRLVIWTLLALGGAAVLLATAYVPLAEWRSAIIVIPVALLFVVIVASPVLLAIRTKVTQDDAVRDGVTAQNSCVHLGMPSDEAENAAAPAIAPAARDESR